MNCGFCSIKAFYSYPQGRPWRIRSNKNVVDEMVSLVKQYGISEILFVDDVFVGSLKTNRDRIKDFVQELRDRNLNVMFSISERVDNIDKELFKELRSVGLRQILLGIESDNEDILRSFNKGIVPEQIGNTIKILQELEIDITVSFIFFNPLASLNDLKRGLDFFVDLKVNILQGLLNKFQIYKGTPLGDKMIKEDKVKGEFPNLCYAFPDERVELAYKIVQNSLGNYLTIAYELKKVERELRVKSYLAEMNKRHEDVLSLKESRILFNGLVTRIMEEAVSLMNKILDFVSQDKYIVEPQINRFSAEIEQEVNSYYRSWLNMLYLFSSYSDLKGLFDKIDLKDIKEGVSYGSV